MKSFASDNYAGAIPEAIQAIIEANREHASAYGNDGLSVKLQQELSDLFGSPAKLHLAFNGTGANVMALSCMVEPFNSILCAETAHIYVDESTAPESLLSCRLLPVMTDQNGKLTAENLRTKLIRIGDLHHPQPSVISITQPTEYGTLYTLDELRAIKKLAEEYHLLIHMDGSRIFLAAAALGISLQQIVEAAGLSILSLGGTKAGLLYGEGVVVFNTTLWQKSSFYHKRSMQLASKSRFIAAQFLALLKNDLWKKYTLKTLENTQRLKAILNKYPQIIITKPVEVNAIFARMPQSWIPLLQQEIPFYTWNDAMNEVRLMCAYDTDIDVIESFDSLLHDLSSDEG